MVVCNVGCIANQSEITLKNEFDYEKNFKIQISFIHKQIYKYFIPLTDKYLGISDSSVKFSLYTINKTGSP